MRRNVWPATCSVSVVVRFTLRTRPYSSICSSTVLYWPSLASACSFERDVAIVTSSSVCSNTVFAHRRESGTELAVTVTVVRLYLPLGVFSWDFDSPG